VSFYAQPDEDAPHATLNFAKGYSRGLGFGQSSMQEFYLADDASCANPERVAFLSFTSSAVETRRVAIEPINMIAITQFSTSLGSTIETLECRTFASYSPLQGHTYEITHRTTPRAQCDLVIIDSATGAAPPDLVMRHPSPCGPSAIPGTPR